MKKLLVIILTVVVSVSFGVNITSAASRCTVLTKGLSLGSTNSTSDSQVSLLQDFLYSGGYLSVSATGRYGNLTVSAVKKFQASHSIDAVGFVGPATRAAIQKETCVANTANNVTNSTINTASVISAIPTYVAPVVENNLISSPPIGSQLTTGQKNTIQWASSDKPLTVRILLEDVNGGAAGHVSGSLSGSTNHYDWTIGNVSLTGQQSAIVAPGKYRLRIVDESTFGSIFNIKSGIFSIVESQLTISRILPNQVPADDETTFVLFGTGFNKSTRLVVKQFYNWILVPQSVAPNGSYMVFTLPRFVPPGQYQLSVYNNYEGSDILATSTPSNEINIQVTQAQ